VDFIIGETFGWLGEALLAVERGKATGLPVMVTVAFENENVTSDGHNAADCAKRLVDAGADIVGINCLRNHYTMMPLLKEMRAATSAYIAAQPVAYRTPAHKHDFTSLQEFPTQLDPLQLSRAEMAGYAREALDAGVNYIGACCGAIASHIRAMAIELGKKKVEEHEWRFDYGKPMSAVEYYKHEKTKS